MLQTFDRNDMQLFRKSVRLQGACQSEAGCSRRHVCTLELTRPTTQAHLCGGISEAPEKSDVLGDRLGGLAKVSWLVVQLFRPA